MAKIFRGGACMINKTWAVLLLQLIFLLHNCTACSPDNRLLYDPNFDEHAQCLDASESPNFDYSCTIEVNGQPPEGSCLSLVYNVNILLKGKTASYENVCVTCLLNSVVQDLLSNSRKYFGTDVSEQITLSKENSALGVALSTWIEDAVPRSQLQNCLEKPFKVKVKWAHGEEYVLIDDQEIKLYSVENGQTGGEERW